MKFLMHTTTPLLAVFLVVLALLVPATVGAQGALKFDTMAVDAGRFAEGDVANVEFPFTNVSDRTVRINRVRTSCGCTASTGNVETIGPGESSSIKASFDTRGRSGRQTSTVTVETDDPAQAHYPLRLALDIVQEVFVTNHLIDMGVLRPGEGATGEFTIVSLLDKPLQVNKVTPSNEIIKVELKESRPFESGEDKGTELVYHFTVPETMPLGDFYFTFNIETDWRANPLRQAVRGRVLGDVDFNPKQFFLSIPAGEERTSTVTFTSRTTHGFEILDATAEVEGLEIRFSTDKQLPRRQQVSATIQAPNRNGTFRGTAIVTTKMDNSDNKMVMEIPLNVVVRQLPNRPAVAGPQQAPGSE